MKYILFFILLAGSLHAGQFAKNKDTPFMTGEARLAAATQAFEKQAFTEAAQHFRMLKLNFASEPYAADAPYFLGICYYNLGHIDVANDEFSDYLKSFNTPKYFQQAIEYKFIIAERLKTGERRHVFGVPVLPKWVTGKALAVEIYDEVIASLPSHDYAAQALYAKGLLLQELKEFRESVESFQALIKRFPRHELTPEAYLAITKVFLEQCQYEFQNPDLITFAEINLRKFALDFPREPRISDMQKDVAAIKEVYAQGLYDTGQYYERMDKWNASIFCYRNAVEKFPDTLVAKKCQERTAYLEERLRRFASDPRDPRFRTNRIKQLAPRQTA